MDKTDFNGLFNYFSRILETFQKNHRLQHASATLENFQMFAAFSGTLVQRPHLPNACKHGLRSDLPQAAQVAERALPLETGTAFEAQVMNIGARRQRWGIQGCR